MEEKIYRIDFYVRPCGCHAPDKCRIAVVGLRNGGTPQIPEIEWPVFRDRLVSNVGFSEERTRKLDGIMSNSGKIDREPIQATISQLKAMGFSGL
jgi:hypothetical protein